MAVSKRASPQLFHFRAMDGCRSRDRSRRVESGPACGYVELKWCELWSRQAAGSKFGRILMHAIRNMTDFFGNQLNKAEAHRTVKICSEANTRAARDKVAFPATGSPFVPRSLGVSASGEMELGQQRTLDASIDHSIFQRLSLQGVRFGQRYLVQRRLIPYTHTSITGHAGSYG
jgi:hypothetical protein